jgi:TrmH family RNA methyltransferase
MWLQFTAGSSSWVLMKYPILTSKHNPLVRTIRLAAGQARSCPPDLVVGEGLRVLEEANLAGCTFEAVLIDENFGVNAREAALLDSWQLRKVPVRRVSASLLKDLSDVVSPQGAVALVRIPRLTMAGVKPKPAPLLLCLSGIQDPGNLGALLRSARAAGVTLVICTMGTVSVRNPKTIRASAGACFHIPVVEGLQPEELIQFCRKQHISMLQARGDAGHSCWTTDLTKPTAIILGNEARGLASAIWGDIPSIRVPMIPGVESLNVAVAGSVLLFEAYRQRTPETAAPTGET